MSAEEVIPRGLVGRGKSSGSEFTVLEAFNRHNWVVKELTRQGSSTHSCKHIAISSGGGPPGSQELIHDLRRPILSPERNRARME